MNRYEVWLTNWTKSIKADIFDLLTKKERPMSFDKTKPFRTYNRYGDDSVATLSEALDIAKKHAVKEYEDAVVYQAVQLVKAPIPGDIVVEKIDVLS